MNYQETLDYLFKQLPMFQRIGKAAYKADLDTTLKLDQYFNHPHKKYKTIHVAGTNGKGSVSHSIASILQESGLKTGLYTSPHYLDFRERIRINGNLISEKSVIDFTQKHKEFFINLKPSFFEITAAMAFEYFAQENIDIAVIEVGMGGRLDSTNIISPILSIITNIGYDHMQFLGDNLKSIAAEKAGIIKKNTRLVIGETKAEIKAVFSQKAQEIDAPIYFAHHNFSVSNSIHSQNNTLFFNINKHSNIQYNSLEFGLNGDYQNQNIITIIQAIELLKDELNISKENIYSGLKKVVENTGIMGRWQILSNKPLTICDAGHNYDGILQVTNQLKNQNFEKLHFIFGAVNDKEISKILNLLPKDAIYYFTKASIERALDQNILINQAINFGLQGNAYSNVELAIVDAKKNAQTNDLIFIGGSSFVVADALAYFNKKS